MNSSFAFLRPCLVLGTGFHRWVLGESMQDDFMPLLDWNELLLTVARSMQDDPRLPFWRTKPCGIEPLICSTWDEGWAQIQAWGVKHVDGVF
jgi:hypothetical protein